jgi:hypothetical protein
MLLEIIRRILNTPTAPTRENLVLSEIKNICEGLDYFTDSFGNVFVGCKSEKRLLSKPFLIVVHTDHPGGIQAVYCQKNWT